MVVEFEGYLDNYQRPPSNSWRDIKFLMCATFTPSNYRRGLLLKLPRLQQGQICVKDYFKELESLMLRDEIDEPNEEKVARFMSGLRRDI